MAEHDLTTIADALPSWSDSSARQAIVDFVVAIADPSSVDFVPEVDRIAVFDNDGTLSAENPYTQLAFAIDRVGELGQPTTVEDLQAGGLPAVLDLLKLTHGSITTEDFDAVIRRWITTARHPRFERAYTAMVYQPMLELLSLLRRHGFTCWIFSGGGADFMRAWAPEVFGLEPHQVIGSSGSVAFQLTDDGPELVKGTDLAILNDGPQKPISIHQSVGQRPLLAAGNTDGDLPMLQWTDANPYRTLQLVVHHTDARREFAYDKDPLLGSGTTQVLAAASEHRWTVINMADDWATIFPPD